MKIAKGLIKGITVLIIVGALGWGIWYRLMPTLNIFKKQEPAMQPKKETVQKGEITAQAARVIIGPLIRRINGAGVVQPYREIPVNVRASGELMSVLVKEGQFVSKGDLLFVVDSLERYIAYHEQDVEWTRAATTYVLEGGNINFQDNTAAKTEIAPMERFIKQATKDWNEADALVKAGKIDKNEYDLRFLNYRIAQAMSTNKSGVLRANLYGVITTLNRLDRAKLDLENTKGIAPISGAVARLSIQQGQQVSAGTKALSILDDTKIRVAIGVLEPEVPELVVGRKAKVTFVGLGDETFNGSVETISPIIENKMCTVTIIIDNPDRKIRTGFYALATIDSKVYENRMLVPKEAVVEQQGRLVVYSVREGKSNWVYVTTGLSNDEYVEILSSDQDQLKAGDLVLVSNNVQIGHDIPVKISNVIK
jgi:RND family efflux transporter MFP subunit